jgi:hypothetical protein
MKIEPEVERPVPPPRSKAGVRLAMVGIGLAAIAGVVLLVLGLQAFSEASDTRDETASLQRARQAVVDRTLVAEGEGDAPIGGAERVASSVGTIAELSITVITESATTNGLLADAVGFTNNGDTGAANRIYEGAAAESVQRLNESLAEAAAALATAQQAATELNASTP